MHLAGGKGKNKSDDSADIKSSVSTQLLLHLIWLQQRWSLGETKDGKEQPQLRAEQLNYLIVFLFPTNQNVEHNLLLADCGGARLAGNNTTRNYEVISLYVQKRGDYSFQGNINSHIF